MKILSVVSLWIVSATAFAQLADPLIFVEKAHDFGNIKETEGAVVYEFSFVNRTTRPIKILSVQTSCGCTTPGWTTEPISPGKSGFVKASFDPKGRPGYFNKSLTVTTDWDGNPILLQIKGNVSTEKKSTYPDWPVAMGEWKLKSKAFNLNKVYFNKENAPVGFSILNAGQTVIQISKVVSPSYLFVEYPEKITPGEEAVIKIRMDAKARNQFGFTVDNIEFKTDDQSEPVKSFSVYATIEEYFPPLSPAELMKAPIAQLEATSLDFGQLGEAAVVKELKLKNPGKRDLFIRNIHSNCQCLEVVVPKMKLVAGEEISLSFKLSADGKKGQLFKSVTIYTSDPRNPTQRILVSGFAE